MNINKDYERLKKLNNKVCVLYPRLTEEEEKEKAELTIKLRKELEI